MNFKVNRTVALGLNLGATFLNNMLVGFLIVFKKSSKDFAKTKKGIIFAPNF